MIKLKVKKFTNEKATKEINKILKGFTNEENVKESEYKTLKNAEFAKLETYDSKCITYLKYADEKETYFIYYKHSWKIYDLSTVLYNLREIYSNFRSIQHYSYHSHRKEVFKIENDMYTYSNTYNTSFADIDTYISNIMNLIKSYEQLELLIQSLEAEFKKAI